MPEATPHARPPRRNKKRNPLTETAILEGALSVFGERGYEAATISAICAAAGVSDATLYEYYASKEDVLFAIPALYTARELARLQELGRFIHDPREKLRAIIQAYLEFYENNRLYTSVALLTLKGNRRFVDAPGYEVVRESARPLVETVREGMEQGRFRADLDPYVVRAMVLGFIEHLTVQWLLVGRPESLAAQREPIFALVMRAIEPEPDAGALRVHVTLAGLPPGGAGATEPE